MALLREWEDLPDYMKCKEVREYYDILYKKRLNILFKRIFDYIIGIILLIVLAIPMIIIAIMIKIDSPGPVFYRQERVTRYGKHFRIHKFRTMVENAEKIGTSITAENDNRITKLGSKIRDYRLDELPQILDVLSGNMSFVGTRPEVVKYVEKYKPEYYSTLLLPAGITSDASIRYKDESKLLASSIDIDKTYIEKVLPSKMEYNLESIEDYSFIKDLITMIRTVLAVIGKEYD